MHFVAINVEQFFTTVLETFGKVDKISRVRNSKITQ